MMSSRLWTYLGKEPVTPHPDATQREGTLWGPHTRGAQGALGHGPFSQRGSGPPQPGTPPPKKSCCPMKPPCACWGSKPAALISPTSDLQVPHPTGGAVSPGATIPARGHESHCKRGAASCQQRLRTLHKQLVTWRHWEKVHGAGGGNTALKGTPRAPLEDMHPLGPFTGQEVGAGHGGGTSDLPMARNTPLAPCQPRTWNGTSWVLPCQPCVQRTAGGSGGMGHAVLVGPPPGNGTGRSCGGNEEP